jgi:putative membrane protein
MTYNSILAMVASGLVMAAAACHENPPPATTTTSMGTENVGIGVTTPSGTTMSTTKAATTFGALRAIHDAEVERGSLAMTRASDQRVKDFATKVVKSHQDALKRDQDIMGRMGVTPQESDVSKVIKSNADKTKDELASKSGSDFDKAYIDDQINYYRSAIDTFDKDLIPNISDPAVKSDVMEARNKNNEHLKEAQDIRAHLMNQ